jgi:hypothetical protein
LVVLFCELSCLGTVRRFFGGLILIMRFHSSRKYDSKTFLQKKELNKANKNKKPRQEPAHIFPSNILNQDVPKGHTQGRGIVFLSRFQKRINYIKIGNV